MARATITRTYNMSLGFRSFGLVSGRSGALGHSSHDSLIPFVPPLWTHSDRINCETPMRSTSFSSFCLLFLSSIERNIYTKNGILWERKNQALPLLTTQGCLQGEHLSSERRWPFTAINFTFQIYNSWPIHNHIKKVQIDRRSLRLYVLLLNQFHLKLLHCISKT